MASVSVYDSVFVVLILTALWLIIIIFQDQITVNKPELSPAIDIVASIILLVVVALLRTIFLDSIFLLESIYPSTIITVIDIGLRFTAFLSVSNLIFIIGPYCFRKIIRLMQELKFLLIRIGARRPEGYVILSYQTDLEMGFCDGECAICLMEFEKEDKCALLDKCGHIFHHLCLHNWLAISSRCPTCRQSTKKLYKRRRT